MAHLGRRETLSETINRDMIMHLQKFPKLSNEITKSFRYVHDLKVMPSMRALQFAGEAVLKNNMRQFNCSYAPIDDTKVFSEALFLLLSGVGFGFSVQQRHISKLPKLKKPNESVRYIVHDSIEGWSDALNTLLEAFFFGKIKPDFDLSLIRAKGSYLVTTGAKAPGPEPLKVMLKQIEERLNLSIGRRLTSLEVHDIVCIISDAVLAGGIRRAALISLFDRTDIAMLKCKHGNWWEKHPYRARANNSAVLPRGKTTKEEFDFIYDMCRDSGSGEPGIYWTNNEDHGTNPCKPLYSTILTDKGYITFEQALKLESLMVMGIDGKYKEASKPFKTGSQRTITKITLSNGKYLFGTENHLQMLESNEWKRMDELEIGDHLKFSTNKIFATEVDNKKEYEDGLFAGWIHGDGWFSKRKDSEGYTVGMCFGNHEFDVVDLFEKMLDVKTTPHAQKPDTCRVFSVHRKVLSDRLLEFGMSLDKNDLTWIYGKSKDFKLGFIKAFFTADGSVRSMNNVEVYSARREALEVVSNVLNEFGIYNTITVHNNAKSYIAKDGKIRNNKTSYKINVYSGQYKKIGFISKLKNELLQNHIEKEIVRYKNHVTIIDIETNYDVQDVYDITVYDETHAFYDSGVVSHNCGEISLKPNQFCNLTTVNQSNIKDKKDFLGRVTAATVLGTIQASYTDFSYLRPIWQQTTEEEALLGVSFTGIADSSGIVTTEWLREGAALAKEVNERIAKKIGINPAARITAIKPEGTASCVLGSASGIHARHSDY